MTREEWLMMSEDDRETYTQRCLMANQLHEALPWIFEWCAQDMVVLVNSLSEEQKTADGGRKQAIDRAFIAALSLLQKINDDLSIA